MQQLVLLQGLQDEHSKAQHKQLVHGNADNGTTWWLIYRHHATKEETKDMTVVPSAT
jgi:hypothetical protein